MAYAGAKQGKRAVVDRNNDFFKEFAYDCLRQKDHSPATAYIQLNPNREQAMIPAPFRDFDQ